MLHYSMTEEIDYTLYTIRKLLTACMVYLLSGTSPPSIVVIEVFKALFYLTLSPDDTTNVLVLGSRHIVLINRCAFENGEAE